MQYSSDPNIRRVEKVRYNAKQLDLISKGTKWCEKCQETLPLEKFTKNASELLGFNKMCKECYHKHYYYPNRDRHLDNAKRWQEKNPERVKELNKIHREKRKKDPSDRMIKNLGKVISTYMCQIPEDNLMPRDYFGCSYAELKKYIESQWQEGMNWDNYGHGKGKWQIDHIIPILAFDLTKPGHISWCCNFHNLRPLWHVENQQKGDKLPNGISVRGFRRSVLEYEYREYLGSLIQGQQGTQLKDFLASYGQEQKVIYVYI